MIMELEYSMLSKLHREIMLSFSRCSRCKSNLVLQLNSCEIWMFTNSRKSNLTCAKQSTQSKPWSYRLVVTNDVAVLTGMAVF